MKETLSHLESLGLSEDQLNALKNAQLTTPQEIQPLTTHQLQLLLNNELSLKSIRDIIKKINNYGSGSSPSPSDSTVDPGESGSEPMVSLSLGDANINKLFGCGEGLPRNSITELVGEPGSGKSHFALFILCRALLDYPDSHVLYIDCHGDFTLKKFENLFSSLYLKEHGESPSSSFLHSIKSHFHTIYVGYDHCKLIALLHLLEIKLLGADFQFSCCCIDGIDLPFKEKRTWSLSSSSSSSVTTLSKVRQRLVSQMKSIARHHSLAFILLNGVTTDPSNNKALKPALGVSWGHSIPYRIMLRFTPKFRSLTLIKSPRLPKQSVHFSIVDSGILSSSSCTSPSSPTSSTSSSQNPFY